MSILFGNSPESAAKWKEPIITMLETWNYNPVKEHF